eukprot:CAMPEP_0172946504 /NCGR_PEP_ID=MMETSP1075-20121228/227096_1 /TAXON_ID=2916 /ORGANISM="Ceratium fusus, Strain PA161109" /LENGTH=195 /DNA_ID=CAMNT_0013807961 /DNA_START=568 /DNA_END=1151 /DNA_ORIENTATION=-
MVQWLVNEQHRQNFSARVDCLPQAEICDADPTDSDLNPFCDAALLVAPLGHLDTHIFDLCPKDWVANHPHTRLCAMLPQSRGESPELVGNAKKVRMEGMEVHTHLQRALEQPRWISQLLVQMHSGQHHLHLPRGSQWLKDAAAVQACASPLSPALRASSAGPEAAAPPRLPYCCQAAEPRLVPVVAQPPPWPVGT